MSNPSLLHSLRFSKSSLGGVGLGLVQTSF